MKSRGKNDEEILQYLNENTRNILAVSFDHPKAGNVTFILHGKFETTYEADVESQTSLLSALSGTDFQAAKYYLTGLKSLPLLPEYQQLNVYLPKPIEAQAHVSPAQSKRRSSDMWLAPKPGNNSAVVSDGEEITLKKSM